MDKNIQILDIIVVRNVVLCSILSRLQRTMIIIFWEIISMISYQGFDFKVFISKKIIQFVISNFWCAQPDHIYFDSFASFFLFLRVVNFSWVLQPILGWSVFYWKCVISPSRHVFCVNQISVLGFFPPCLVLGQETFLKDTFLGAIISQAWIYLFSKLKILLFSIWFRRWPDRGPNGIFAHVRLWSSHTPDAI